ncbi:hypothetical protein FNT36_01240 [Hymenobacter setariae]|uniref:Uncharacterized protein n=1 Tax=Hymenobacter setariae TaxID=2594794 RepID=A0A558C1T6_9BACT|nr:hypothetical protein [Hymenobacter setariae]TVT42748.1 hypothetical protein FNT36_01240 [Hymenobacter setariae]
MKLRVLSMFGRGPLYIVPLLVLLLASCRTCPIDACHARKAHLHNGVKYRARPIWKMQYPAVGERIKLNSEGKNRRRASDHSKSLK